MDGRKIVIDEFNSEVVKFVYEQYSKGVIVKDIIAELTAKGITKNGVEFAQNSVYNILKNEKYSGVYMHGEEVIDNMYPQIVSKDIYDIVREKINKNRYGRKCVHVDFLLRQKITCGYCGHSINGESGTSRNGTKVYYYKCRGRKKHLAKCDKSVIRKEELEKIVLDTVIQELSKAKTIKSIVNGLLDYQNTEITANSSLSLLAKQKKQVDTALNNLIGAIERGIISNTTNKRLKELEQQQEDLERQILIERSKTTIKLNESEIRQYYEQVLNLEPQMLINYLIKQIVLFDDKIEIYFNSPIRKSPDDDNQGFLFYSKLIKFDLQQILFEIYA